MNFLLKSITILFITVLSNSTFAQSNNEVQSDDLNTQENITTLDGLLPKLELLIKKVEQLENRSISCRVTEGRPTKSGTWTNASTAQCVENEFLTGGGCNSNSGYGGSHRVINDTGVMKYQCNMDHPGHGNKITAQAICCKYQ